MDLIYANQNKEDIGVLMFYKLDMAYGESENDFELELNLSEHCMEPGFYIYAENTEYGGVVDGIYVDNGNQIVKYRGRTWHGILAKSVILPDDDYLVVSGDANEIIGDLITRQGLDDLFSVAAESSGVEVAEYSFRYNDVYHGILDMLKEYHGKISFTWRNGKVELSCHLAIDFTNDDEWDSSQIEFEISQNARPTNHLVCLGQGDLSDRAVIHLFTDADGNIQPYANENPMEDADYILDESQQVLFDVDEVAEVYDYPSAEVLTTYIPLMEKPADYITNHTSYYKRGEGEGYDSLVVTQQEKYSVLASQPADWNSRFGNYYVMQSGEYVQVEAVESTLYTALSSQPSDWNSNYRNYYEKSGNEYNSVESISKNNYKKLSNEPKDWKKNYGKYYTFNGVDYDSVSGDSKPVYHMHTGKPSDWSDNYDSYYWKVPKYGIKKSNNSKGYEIYVKDSVWMTAGQLYVVDQDKVKEWQKATGSKKDKININVMILYVDKYKKKPKWKKNTYYNRDSKSVAPKFRANYYYSLTISVSAPNFVANRFYSKKTVVTAPTFVTNTYYSKAIVDVYEEFVAGQIFRQSHDRFAALVQDGIKKINEMFAEKDSVNVNLEELQTYDINDIVGARESVTGLSVKHYISKKIIKIQNGIISVDYTIGKE